MSNLDTDLAIEVSAVTHPAVDAIADVMRQARVSGKHPPYRWRDGEHHDHHVARAIRHLQLLMIGDTSEPHLQHALCRVAMALAVSEES